MKIKEIMDKLNITKQDLKMFGKFLGVAMLSNLALWFTIPLAYVYARPIWPVVQYLPIMVLSLLILWVLRYALKKEKKKDG